jgi:hypothetical protein
MISHGAPRVVSRLAEAGTDAPFRPPVTLNVSSLLKAEDPRR